MKKKKRNNWFFKTLIQKMLGSSEVQIGLLSEKINNLTDHFKKIKMINIQPEDYCSL